ncbi:MAG: YdcF family protein [Clostridiales bacterium]|nr:YdcF family protein [Clostridiales bacterium]
MLKYIDIFVGILILIYTIIINIIYGKISFSEIFYCIGILLIIFHFIKIILYKNKILKKLYNIIKCIIVLVLTAFIIIASIIIIFPKKDTSYSDYVIVLGAGLKGEWITLTLRNRLDKTVEYVKKQEKECKIIVSGGQGKGEDISEAEAMKKYLIEKGVDKDLIIMEDKSTNTKENLTFSKDIIEKIEGKYIKNNKVTVITTDFHAFRSNMLAKHLEYKNISFYTSKTESLLVPIQYFREALAVIKSFIIDIKLS